jgi:hypothetical protein
MQLDAVLLAYAVEATDALFEQVRIAQVRQHLSGGRTGSCDPQTDFQTDQHLGAEFFIGEVGRRAVVRGCSCLRGTHWPGCLCARK